MAPPKHGPAATRWTGALRRAAIPAALPVVENAPAVPAGTVYLVRHGLVHNPARMMYGWLPRFRLADEGRAQAEATAEYLARTAGDEIRLLLTSPLLRAIQTARIIAARLPGVRTRRSDLLVESGLARYWQGNYWHTLPERFPDEYKAWQAGAGALEIGEPMAAMARRMQAALALALRLSGGSPAVCVSHRDPIAALRLAVEGRSFDELHTTA
jgi:broad specificity phosphatase PhoE